MRDARLIATAEERATFFEEEGFAHAMGKDAMRYGGRSLRVPSANGGAVVPVTFTRSSASFFLAACKRTLERAWTGLRGAFWSSPKRTCSVLCVFCFAQECSLRPLCYTTAARCYAAERGETVFDGDTRFLKRE